MDCIFCKIASGEIAGERIWEDGLFAAFLDINPINPGHTLVVPKAHIESVFDMEAEYFSALFEAARKLAGPLRKATGAKRIGVIVEGFAVSHSHVHLVPLHHGGELDFGRAKKASPEELSAMGKRIREGI